MDKTPWKDGEWSCGKDDYCRYPALILQEARPVSFVRMLLMSHKNFCMELFAFVDRPSDIREVKFFSAWNTSQPIDKAGKALCKQEYRQFRLCIST